ncbi:DUF3558 domain-containing protein [Actinokineospora sp. NBRC 105648]|uniref:DUF3558 domain-containing protein n=1 Tax=Actinokineospora sp. NBRC 105648 TaxID=3032206 RepID=UPI00249FEC5D|nr:DUF3558 domain-containing protein [Actinokineospora sp. NBRC 105648]GLZ42313.1 hypothetical protein Acsp05_59370 [Actinokineospora sp. NBRC 105648]
MRVLLAAVLFTALAACSTPAPPPVTTPPDTSAPPTSRTPPPVTRPVSLQAYLANPCSLVQDADLQVLGFPADSGSAVSTRKSCHWQSSDPDLGIVRISLDIDRSPLVAFYADDSESHEVHEEYYLQGVPAVTVAEHADGRSGCSILLATSDGAGVTLTKYPDKAATPVPAATLCDQLKTVAGSVLTRLST